MEIEKVLTYTAMGVAGLVCLIFLLDLALAVLGRNLVLDILFILGGAFVLWQGFETIARAAVKAGHGIRRRPSATRSIRARTRPSQV